MTIRNSKAVSMSVTNFEVASEKKARTSRFSIPKLPHERDESTDGKASIPSNVMTQASLDQVRGLKDTDRGPQMAKTYKKLKLAQTKPQVRGDVKRGRR